VKKSILAVAVGVLVVVVATTLVDGLLHAVGVFPSGQPIDDRLAVLATSYRILIGVGGGWLTARLAPNSPMRHAMILGYVGTVLGLIGVVVTWNLGLGPRWYPIALAALAVPQSWAGGAIAVLRAPQGRASDRPLTG
jgi:hypothetical protein